MKPKAVPYKKGRFQIIDEDTGEVLDNANGYGYKTKQKAHAGYAWNSKSKKEKNEAKQKTRQIQNWLRDKNVDKELETIAWYKWKDMREDINTADVKAFLKTEKIETNYKASEILRAWRKM